MMLTNLNERSREIAILRAVGARPVHVGAIFLTESILITGIGCLIGLLLFYGVLVALQPIIDARFGLFMPITVPSSKDWLVLCYVMIGSIVAGLVPAFMAYHRSLADGMTIRN